MRTVEQATDVGICCITFVLANGIPEVAGCKSSLTIFSEGLTTFLLLW